MRLHSDLLHALDAATFASEALGIEPDAWQADVLRSSSSRLLLNCCRQSGKSTTAGVLGLHTALYRPGALVLIVSPSQRQSTELFRKVSDLVTRLPQRPDMVEDTKTSATFGNGSRIISLPGTEGTIRGYSAASLIIEDEAAWVSPETHDAVLPMLAVSRGRLVLMSTPFGKRGHFHAEWTRGGDDWERVQITATDVVRIGDDFLDEQRRRMSEMKFRAEYLCEFTETDDAVFAYADIDAALSHSVSPLFGAS